MVDQAPQRMVGTSVPRKEDAALTTGQANWTDNIELPGTVHLAVLRSQLAHAKIAAIDTTSAREHPGVVGAFSGAQLQGERSRIPTAWPVTEDSWIPEHLPVAVEEVRFAGEAVAVVAAHDLAPPRVA